MPPKTKVPAPIDRPLSRAYLRGFTGWSTAFPPGSSEPTSLRVMENMMVDRNQALAIRPGLRYLSYTSSPDMDPVDDGVLGDAIGLQMIGTQEPFYTADGSKALLCAVREVDGTVGFRAILFSGATTVVHSLVDPTIGFTIPQGTSVLNFSSATTYVRYVQINNRIIAMSDAGEPIRMFFVGDKKVAKKLNTITAPKWDDSHKLSVMHPVSSWIAKQTYLVRRNEIPNPSFELGTAYWGKGATTEWGISDLGSDVGPGPVLEVRSAPQRTNMATSPLHNVSSTGISGWHPHKNWGDPKLTADGDYLKVYDAKGSGTFLSYGAKLSHGVAEGQAYTVAVSYKIGTHVEPIVVLTFYNAAGAKIGKSTTMAMPKSDGRFVSPAIAAPTGTTTMRISLGGRNEKASSTFVKFKDVVLCKAGESTAIFHGGSGTNYFWTGTANQSASVYHPPATVSVSSPRGSITPGGAVCSSVYAIDHPPAYSRTLTIGLRTFDKNGTQVGYSTGSAVGTAAWQRLEIGTGAAPATAVSAQFEVSVTGVTRGEVFYFDAGMLEAGVSTAGTYFDGSSAPASTSWSEWANRGAPHASVSLRITRAEVNPTPTAATPTANTLIATGGPTANPYKMAFFYTFENEVGESAASKITEVRVSRPWSNWRWQTANDSSEPSGTATEVADLCADQLVALIPAGVYAAAISEGAVRWTLYVLSWSDQEPVPVVGVQAGTRELYPADSAGVNALAYNEGGWINITPSRKVTLNDAVLPTASNRENFSRPPGARAGLVAGDRIVLVGDPNELATIRWSSNRPGEYTNFTASRGGGAKTLTTGNLNIPAAVVLWQNPQSVDTLTILCMGSDGQSVSFYMQPASVNAQSGSTAVMGFEETTSTPGTLSPYAAEVLNNALYRPIDRGLLKSTANNYNISHKTQTDKIANVWWNLRSKQWMISAQLDNRLYFLVHNPLGELLEEGCKGNELWVYDVSAENGHWSRFLIQGCALRPFNVGTRTYMGVTRPDGLYYLDPDARMDDYVDSEGKVRQRPIPWRFETNTQGANRAHDAWAHLQQVQVTLGDFQGSMRYGIRGLDLHGKWVEIVKEFTDSRPLMDEGSLWDVSDTMLVRRDLKEWFLFGYSVDDLPSSGHLGLVQYRYTPVSVNVGYEFGSVETFEYGANVALGPDAYAENGIPLTYMDYTRP